MQQRTDALIASADKLMAGLTDVAGSANATETDLNKGAEGSLPEQTVTVDTTDGTLEIPVDEGTIDLLFTIECNVVNPITTEIGTQEVRVGKTHTVKTDKFELMNGVILDCEWGDGAAAADAQ